MTERRRYANPPLEEALCEFRFGPGQDWDLTIPGKLQAQFGDEYAGKPREQKVVELGLEAQEGRPPNVRYGEGVARVQLVSKDGTRLVGVGPDVLSIHMLRPYQAGGSPDQTGWNEFRARIAAALDAYWKVAEPVGVSRIGIRYINKIVIPKATVRIEHYLRSALPDVEGLPDRLNNFVSRVDYVYDDGVRLVLSQGSIDAPVDHVGFLLDLDVIWEHSKPVTRDDALLKADSLRDRERVAFEAVITDVARRLFDAD